MVSFQSFFSVHVLGIEDPTYNSPQEKYYDHIYHPSYYGGVLPHPLATWLGGVMAAGPPFVTLRPILLKYLRMWEVLPIELN